MERSTNEAQNGSIPGAFRVLSKDKANWICETVCGRFVYHLVADLMQDPLNTKWVSPKFFSLNNSELISVYVSHVPMITTYGADLTPVSVLYQFNHNSRFPNAIVFTAQ